MLTDGSVGEWDDLLSFDRLNDLSARHMTMRSQTETSKTDLYGIVEENTGEGDQYDQGHPDIF